MVGCFRCALAACIIVAALPAADVPPVLTDQFDPVYSPDLVYWTAEPARVEIVVDERGEPFSFVSNTGLPDNVVRALARWRFKPGTSNGRNSAFKVTVIQQVHRPLTPASDFGHRRPALSKDVSNAIASAKTLDDAKAAELDASLLKTPENLSTRAELLAYDEKHREVQLAWWIANRPADPILGSPYATPTADPEVIRKLWIDQLSKTPGLLENATNFLRLADPVRAEQALLPEVNRVSGAAGMLGDVYGLAALGVLRIKPGTGAVDSVSSTPPDSEFARHARSVITHSADVRVVLSALTTIANAGRALAKDSQAPNHFSPLCEEVLAHAKQLYPETSASCDLAGATGAENAFSLRVGGDIAQARLVKQARPTYPAEAKARFITGTVHFSAMIGTDGAIHDLQLLGGPLALYDSSRNAVIGWVYRPTLLNNKPVEVITTIDVNYTLSR